jgi:gluconokinase
MLQTFEPPHSKPAHYTDALSPPISTPVSPSPDEAAKPTVEHIEMVATTTHHHIFIVTGPAGCGKSTVAKFLAARYGFEYIEGDDVSIVFACISMHF